MESRVRIWLRVAYLVWLLAACLTGCSPKGQLKSISLLPATYSSRIETTVDLPNKAFLHLRWLAWVPAVGPTNLRGKPATLEVWLQQIDGFAERVFLQTFPLGAESESINIDLSKYAGERVSLRAVIRGHRNIDVKWLRAALTGRTEDPNRSYQVEASPSAPNVIVYLVDALRPDVLGFNGGKAATPTIDRVASGGIVFDRAYSTTSWTRPAVASLFSGLYPESHRITSEAFSLPEEVITLAERFSLAGYDTFGVTGNGHVDAAFNFDQGFKAYGRPEQASEPVSQPSLSEPSMKHPSAADVHALTMLGLKDLRDPDRPLFLYVHTVDPHTPYDPPEWLLEGDRPDIAIDSRLETKINAEGATQSTMDLIYRRYLGSVAYADAELGQFLNAMSRFVDFDNTIFVFLSDHGEAFLEHGTFTHRHSLYEEELRIPLLVRAPGRIPAGIRSNEPVSIIDVPRLLVRLAGIPSDNADQGVPLNVITPNHAPPTRAVAARLERGNESAYSLLNGNWKMIIDPTFGAPQLFDLEHDPSETENLATTHRKVIERLERSLAKLNLDRDTRSVNALPADPLEIPKEVVRNLRALGYIDG